MNHWSEASGDPPPTVTGGGGGHVVRLEGSEASAHLMAVLLSSWGRMLGHQTHRKVETEASLKQSWRTNLLKTAASPPPLCKRLF